MIGIFSTAWTPALFTFEDASASPLCVFIACEKGSCHMRSWLATVTDIPVLYGCSASGRQTVPVEWAAQLGAEPLR